MNMAIRVNGCWIRLLSDWLDQQQLAAPNIRAQITRYRPTDEVPISHWQFLLQQAQELAPDDAGMLVAIASCVTPAHVGVLGYLVMACDHLGQAMQTYQRYETLFYGQPLAETSVQSDNAGIFWQPQPPLPLAEEVGLCALVHFIRQQLGQPQAMPLISVSFCHQPQPERMEAMQEFFKCPVVGGQVHSGLRFDAAVLQRPLLNSEPGLRQLLEQQASAMLQALPEPDEFEQQLQAQLVRRLPEGNARIDSIAKELNCSVRTLQRRLEQRQISWQTLLDNTREHLARQYLFNPSLSLLDIALLLGYRDQSTFTRSFKRWYGKTPRSYRNEHCQNNTNVSFNSNA